MRKFIFLITLCFVTLIVAAQHGFTLAKTLEGKWHDFEVDNLGNTYLITGDMQIKKMDEHFDSIGIFNEVRNYGTLYSIDASNPLRIILWYKDFATLVILDRFLNRRAIIDLRKTGILQCNAIAQSYDNNIWLYDDLDSKVKKINEEGTVLLESADFRVLFDDPPRPFKLEDYNKKLYAYDSSRGLVVMDYFGAYQQIFSYKGWRNLQGFGKGLLAADDHNLIYIPADGINVTTMPLPPEIQAFKKIRAQGGKLYVLNQAGVISMYHMPDNLLNK